MNDPKVYEVIIYGYIKKTVQVSATESALDNRIAEVIEELEHSTQADLGAVFEFDAVDVNELM